jgi:hypothetical protein
MAVNTSLPIRPKPLIATLAAMGASRKKSCWRYWRIFQSSLTLFSVIGGTRLAEFRPMS